jgi:hypothetical protein
MALAVLAGAMILVATPAAPAAGGGWAVTYLDPAPDRFETGRAYTIGFWVLQHGSHAYDGDLGETALSLVDERGNQTRFAGVRLPEPAHYAAAIAVPVAGRYRVVAAQGLFAPYEVGTLVVPGRLVIAPTPTPLAIHDDHSDGWGVIGPPVAGKARAEDPSATPASTDAAPTPVGAAGAVPPAGGSASGGRWLVGVTVASAAVALASLAVAGRRPLRAAVRSLRRRTPGDAAGRPDPTG